MFLNVVFMFGKFNILKENLSIVINANQKKLILFYTYILKETSFDKAFGELFDVLM